MLSKQSSECGEVGESADGSLGNAEGIQPRVGSFSSVQLKQPQHKLQQVYKKQIELVGKQYQRLEIKPPKRVSGLVQGCR